MKMQDFLIYKGISFGKDGGEAYTGGIVAIYSLVRQSSYETVDLTEMGFGVMARILDQTPLFADLEGGIFAFYGTDATMAALPLLGNSVLVPQGNSSAVIYGETCMCVVAHEDIVESGMFPKTGIWMAKKFGEENTYTSCVAWESK